MKNLFLNIKRIDLTTLIFKTIATVFWLGSGLVFYGQEVNLLSFMWGAIGCIPILIWYLLIKSLNEVTDAFYIETEEKAKQSQKFQACFDNVDESIVLISGDQIEYVNDRFLLQFIGSINRIEFSK